MRPQASRALSALSALSALTALGALSALLPLAAHAASFDCAKAKSPSEKLICSDAALGALDERLAAAYKGVSAALSAPQRATLKESQRSWLKSWPLECSADARAKPLSLGASALPCAKASYERRLRDLGLTRDLGGAFTVYTLAYYSALPGPTAEELGGEEGGVARHTLRAPQVAEEGLAGDALALAKAVNAWLTPTAEELKSLKGNGGETHFTVTLTAVTPALWRAAVSREEMYFGAAHESNSSEYRWFWTTQRRPLVAADVFGAPGWEATLAQLTFSALKGSIPDDLDVSDPQSAEFVKLVSAPRSWDLTRAGLELNFDPYAVASYAAGPQSVVVPWAPLEALLTPSFKEARKGLR